MHSSNYIEETDDKKELDITRHDCMSAQSILTLWRRNLL